MALAVPDPDVERLADRYKNGQTLSAGELEYLRSSVSLERWDKLQFGRVEIKPLRPEIVPGKSEAEIAAEFRDEAVARLAPVVDLINEARQKGMQINFQIGPPDSFNRQSLVMLEITKKLC